MDGADKFVNSGRPIGEILDIAIQISKEQNLIGEPCSWNFSQFDLINSAK